MNMTHEWVSKQIENYKKLVMTLNKNDPLDKNLYLIWSSTLNTLTSTLRVIEIEQGIK